MAHHLLSFVAMGMVFMPQLCCGQGDEMTVIPHFRSKRMKARLETGTSEPRTPHRLCRGCFEASIPITQELCGQCAHIQKLQTLANSIAQLGNGGTQADKAGYFDMMYERALELARGDT